MDRRRLLKLNLHCHFRRRSQIDQPHDPRSCFHLIEIKIRKSFRKIIWQRKQTLFHVQAIDQFFNLISHQIKLRKRHENPRSLKQHQKHHCWRKRKLQISWRKSLSWLGKIIISPLIRKIKTHRQNRQIKKFNWSHHHFTRLT